ncbi:zf-HC2 domain-containing protein [Promicromonospora soli]
MTRTGGAGDRHAAARRADVAVLRSALSVLADDAVALPRTAHQPECRATRAAMHDYVKARLVPSRQRRVEAHLDRCDPCTRAFIDVREVSWALRGLGRRLAADGRPGGRHRRAASAAPATSR